MSEIQSIGGQKRKIENDTVDGTPAKILRVEDCGAQKNEELDNKAEIKIKTEDDETCVYSVVLKDADGEGNISEGVGSDTGANQDTEVKLEVKDEEEEDDDFQVVAEWKTSDGGQGEEEPPTDSQKSDENLANAGKLMIFHMYGRLKGTLPNIKEKRNYRRSESRVGFFSTTKQSYFFKLIFINYDIKYVQGNNNTKVCEIYKFVFNRHEMSNT